MKVNQALPLYKHNQVWTELQQVLTGKKKVPQSVHSLEKHLKIKGNTNDQVFKINNEVHVALWGKDGQKYGHELCYDNTICDKN